MSTYQFYKLIHHFSFKLVILSLTILTMFMVGVPNTQANGDIEISTCAELQLIGSDPVEYPLSGNYVLTADIDCSDSSSWNGGAGFIPIGNEANKFTGTFDGAGFIIHQLTIDRPATDFVGLFGYADNGVDIFRVYLTESFVRGRTNVGSIVGRLGENNGDAEAMLTQSFAVGTVISTNNTVGGLVGLAHNGRITDTFFRGAVTSNSWDAGGLTGYVEASIIQNSYVAATVVSSTATPYGIVGWLAGASTIVSSFWDFDVSGVASGSNGTGATGRRTTVEMKTQSVFEDAGWNFDTLWGVDPDINDGYPFFGQSAVVIEPIEVTAPVAMNITTTSADLEAEITSGVVREYGFFWGLTSHADENVIVSEETLFEDMSALYENTNGQTDDDPVAIPFVYITEAQDLTCNTTYYARAIVLDSQGEGAINQYAFSEEITFTTLPCVPPQNAPRPRSSSGGIRLSSAQLAEMGVTINPQSTSEAPDPSLDRTTRILALLTTLEKDDQGKITQAGFIQFIMGLISILR
ncbi:MAG: hypothetical protein LRY44_01690 [Candidatus Pacebacteria bacterium]|nr:hypothetical protein [Candidatus Paceibacterota bacterium]MCD8563706.1 hypothetical protein [Candidatus Paceibacterota bacterium]